MQLLNKHSCCSCLSLSPPPPLAHAAIKAFAELSQFDVWRSTGANPSDQDATGGASVVIDENAGDVTVRLDFENLADIESVVLFGPGDINSLPTADNNVRVRLTSSTSSNAKFFVRILLR